MTRNIKISRLMFLVLFLFTSLSPVLTQKQIKNLEGWILDGATNQPIPFAHIISLPDSSGVYSLLDGSFRLQIEKNLITHLDISCLGYERLNLPLGLLDSDSLIIELNQKSIISDEIIISSSKKTQSLSLAPASVTVLKNTEITNKSLNTFDQLLEQANSVQLTRSSGSNVQAVSIRGSSEVAGGGIGNRVLLLIDGRPSLSPESGGALWNLVPINSIERIEILKGPYSSLYGSSAVGGVINVISKKPTNAFNFTIKSKLGIYDSAPLNSEYLESGKFYLLSAGISNQINKLGYIADLSFQSNEGHREKAAYDMMNFYGKVELDLESNRTLKISANINSIYNDTPASWLSHRLAYSVADYKKDDYQRRKEFALDANYSVIPNATTKLESKIYGYRNYSEFDFNDDPFNDTTNVNFGKQTVDFEFVEANRMGMINQLDFFKANHYLVGGLDLQYDFINGQPDTVLYGKHKSIGVGIYLQDEISFSKKLTLTTGLRFDYFNIINRYRESNLSPKMALVYRPRENLSFRMLYARAFRNPSIAERFIKFEQGGGLRFLPNPDLVAEKLSFSLETGLMWKLSNYANLDFSLYYNRYEDLISFQQLSQPGQELVFQVINLNEAEMKGFEVSSNINLANLDINFSYNLLSAKDVSENRFNDELAYKIKHNFNYTITTDFRNFDFTLFGKYKSAVQEVFIYPGSEPESYFLHSFRLGWNINTKLVFGFTIRNIFDVAYEELERYRMAGRSFTLNFSYN